MNRIYKNMEEQCNSKVSKKFLLFVIFALVITVFIKCFQEMIFPQKYFADSYHILLNMIGKGGTDSTYTFTANFFKTINFFGFTTLKEWRYFITLIFFPITIYIVWKGIEYSDFDYVFILSSIILIDIYIFNLSKDIIQFIFFLLMGLVLSSQQKTDTQKIFNLCLILIFESLYFRVYYALLAILIVTLYIISIFVSKDNIFKFILITFVAFFLEVLVFSFLSPENYDSLINARYSVNIWRGQDINAVTIINEPFGQNNNFFKFIGNYTINFIRFLFPVELLIKGPKYIGFVLYQLVIVKYLNKCRKNLRKDNCLVFIVFISYIMVSVTFEPDYGSLVRHEAATLPILLLIIQNSYQKSS